ncbi:myosin-G heavy chain [Octopus bimaculoides]|uniref:Myb/SANT-like DNA-binding domain-containing protein n=1 Tax=Octopus bimaculoides TaxID=37653 RepID=A0A0L8ICQ2_OCTBM|nr:myosin-G heavy chain [Octopus bimaculoides]|eukprot:XP_014776772.1 PREDICTED: myosin-G heavy chain-like [Octopus bimaculoides]
MNDTKFLFKKRSKKRNFSEKEVSILTHEYEKHMIILNSKLTNSITNQKKQRIWERITDAINAVGVNRRRVSEVKEKWRNMQRKARRMFAERKINLRTFEELDNLNIATTSPSSLINGNRVVRLAAIGPDKQQHVQQQQQQQPQQQPPPPPSLLDVQLEPLGGGGGGGVVITAADGIDPTATVTQVTTDGSDPGYSIAAGSTTVTTTVNGNNSNININSIKNNNTNSNHVPNNNNTLVSNATVVTNSLINGDSLVNDPGVGEDLTIVIKEEIPDPVLKDEPLLTNEIQNEPVERVLTDGANTEILPDSVTCNAASIADNNYNNYNSHKFTINLTDNNAGTTTHTPARTPSRSQRPFTSFNSSKLRPLTGMSLSTKRMYSSPLSSTRPFSRNRSVRNFLLKSSNSAIPTSMISPNASSNSSLPSRTLNSYRSFPVSSASLTSSPLNQEPSLAATLPHSAKSSHQSSMNSAATVTQGDLLQLQYEVLLADKKRIQTQTRYYEMKMKRIEFELSGQSNTFF